MHGASGSGEAATQPASAESQLNAILHDYLKELFQRGPLTATRLGDHGRDDQLDDLSSQGRQATLDFKPRTLASLPRSIDVAGLSRDGKIDYEISRGHLERAVWLAENVRHFEDDPRIHKMHVGAMTDSEALDLLMSRAFQTESEAVGKTIRAKQTSCQLSTYFAGRMAFCRLRQAIGRELGDRFNLSRYHQTVLAHGTIPMKYLPELVRASLRLEVKTKSQRR
jgi:uncharacterized protein (DUF885 family)